MRSTYTGRNPRLVVRVTHEEMKNWTRAAEDRNLYMQTVVHALLEQWYRLGAPTDVKSIKYTDPKEAYCMHVLHTAPSELSEAEVLLQRLINEVFLLKQAEKKEKIKGKNRNGTLQYAG